MSNFHRPRRDRINKVRDLIDAIRDARTHNSFLAKLSGFDAAGNSSGPFGGLEYRPKNGAHQNNGDENRADFAGNFSKGLRHGPLSGGGLVVPGDYVAFRNALGRVIEDARDGDPLCDHASVTEIDQIGRPLTAAERRAYVNPLAGVATDYAGLDPFDISQPPAPRFNQAHAAVEMAELYWMALLRDLPFDQWDGSADIAAAIAELDGLNAGIGGMFATHRRGTDRTAWDPAIELATLFRGSAPGNDAGGYISQFLLHDVPFGTLDMAQKQKIIPATDYMTTEPEWSAVQEGVRKPSGRSEIEGTHGGDPPWAEPCGVGRRHIVTLRDLAHYVHYDALHEAYFNAALIMARMGVTLSYTNAYEQPVDLVDLHGQAVMADHRREGVQEGFGTFGGPAALVLLSEVATRALKAVWHQKWYVHRRLRPEASGARIHAALQPGASGEVKALAHQGTLRKASGDPLECLQRTQAKFGSFLLPVAFPEGSPMHPSYGAGHATVAGACVTVLKALFEPRFVLPEVVVPTTIRDGSTKLVRGPNTDGLTVEGELNKIAANIAIGRNVGGVHYRTDYTKSLALGEAVAVAQLQEMAPTFVEAVLVGDKQLPVWALPTFDGHWISIDCTGEIERGITPAAVSQPSAVPPAPERAPATMAA